MPGRGRWTLLIGVGGLSAALLWGEWTILTEQVSPDSSQALVAEAAASDPTPVPALPFEVSAVIGRPIFTRGRRPAEAKSPVVPTRESLPRLSGVLIGGDDRRALFVPRQGGRTIVLREGDSLGEATILAIRAGEVILATGAAKRVVKLAADMRRPSDRIISSLETPRSGLPQ